jgi:glycosyltransferase involved in cell wall biosynthesis
LEALHELKRRGVGGFRALVVGEVYPGYEELRAALREKVKTLGLDNEVEFLGHRDDADSIFQSIDIAVSPSTLPEPFGLVVAEAMAARRPVIATAAGGPSELIEDGVSGFLIPMNNVGAFADRLERLISDRSLRERIGAAARHRIERGFSAEAFDRAVRQLVEDTIGHPSPCAEKRGRGQEAEPAVCTSAGNQYCK